MFVSVFSICLCLCLCTYLHLSLSLYIFAFVLLFLKIQSTVATDKDVGPGFVSPIPCLPSSSAQIFNLDLFFNFARISSKTCSDFPSVSLCFLLFYFFFLLFFNFARNSSKTCLDFPSVSLFESKTIRYLFWFAAKIIFLNSDAKKDNAFNSKDSPTVVNLLEGDIGYQKSGAVGEIIHRLWIIWRKWLLVLVADALTTLEYNIQWRAGTIRGDCNTHVLNM